MNLKQERIVIINSFYYPTIIGGAEISTQILSELLVKAFEEVIVITTGPQKKGIVSETINGVKVYRLPYNNIYWKGDKKRHSTVAKIFWHIVNLYNLKQHKLLKKLLLQIDPVIIHTQNLTGIGFVAWRLANLLNIPLVHTLRDYELLKGADSKVLSMMSRMGKRFSRYVDAITGVSKYTLERYTDQNFFMNAERNVIYNVVQDKVVSQEKLAPVPQKPLVLSYYGQLVPNKGVALMIQAIKEIPSEIVGTIFIYGDGPLKNEILALIQDDQRFEYAGKALKEEVYRNMHEIDLTIVPSTWPEPFGRVIIESYRQGTPVIAAAVGGIPEVILSDEFLFEAGNKVSLIESIEKYWLAEKGDIAKRCIEHSQLFNESYLLKEHLHVYARMLKSEEEKDLKHLKETVV